MSMTRNEFRQQAALYSLQAVMTRTGALNPQSQDSLMIAQTAMNYANALTTEFQKHGRFDDGTEGK